MRRVTCKDCGRLYDYDKDDFCPRCGSYNPPSGEGSTQLERELLSRFDRNREYQTSDMEQQRQRAAAPAGKAAPVRQTATVRSSAPASSAPCQYYHGGEPCEEAARPKNGVKTALIVLLVLGVAAIVGVVLWSLSTEAGSNLPAEAAVYTYGEYDTVPVGKLSAEIDDVRWLALPQGFRLYREGYDLLLVDMYITGGSGCRKSDPMGAVYLDLGEETVPLETDVLIASKLKDLSVYAIELQDAVWEDPLMGSFAFYVPQGAEIATLCMEEVKARGDSRQVTAVHRVELDLPGHEGA